ncbi:MAG: tRNA (adenosine(37)-N6)-dimethylallyltransferase MiaA [Anaerolineae bacterium]
MTPASEQLPPLVIIVGPTAVGKTDLAVCLAQEVDGEIVSADSRQVYRGMDIGTAKATPEEQAHSPHHLLDVVDPDETLGLAQFQEMAYAAIADVTARGRVPLLVGGTGQYVMAVVEGWNVPRVPPDEALRRELYQQADQEGAQALHDRLRALDPAAAERLDARNVRRVVRALEVCLVTGEPISEQQVKTPPPYRMLKLGLSLPREALYRRIDERVEYMMAAGLEDEVRGLVAAGYGFDLPAMSGVGYGQFAPYLAGEATLESVARDIKRATRRFVRHQANWFRQDDARIEWLHAAQELCSAALELVRPFLVG